MTKHIARAASFPTSRLGRGLYLSPDDGGGAGGGSDDKTTEEPDFTPGQHVKVNEIAAKARREGEAKGKKDAEKTIFGAFDVASLDDLRAKLDAPAERDKGKLDEQLVKRDAEWKSKLDAALKERDDARTGADQVRRDYQHKERHAALVNAAAKVKAIDPQIVAQLTADGIDFADDGSLFVKGDGAPRINAKGNPMSLDEFVSAYVAERQFLVQGSGTQGAGSTTTGKPGKYTRAQLDAMSPDEINTNWPAISAQMEAGAIT